MGIHICFIKFEEGKYSENRDIDVFEEGKYSENRYIDVFKEIKEPGIRMQGDNDFVHKLKYPRKIIECGTQDAFRPSDFTKAREEVENNIKYNKDRFIKILNYLENNEEIYLWVSY